MIDERLAGRAFAFPVERAIFTAVLHRIMVSGSDRACEKWRADYAIPGADELDLHHFYRAMAWLGEELPSEAAQQHATPFAPRTIKDQIEEALFARRRDLFSDLSVVFLHDSRRSVLSQLPDVFDRASVFRPGWVGPWLFWLLSAAVLLGVPLLLARALAESEGAPAEDRKSVV